ncbi:hypothetical protein LPJ81_003199 [Coemansia sp. IMI 209127]|nr:hypothetical protein LPJ81_003199 [Coemansia sp. IMI 209127]
MADPFANLRRRPAATATYGRKALAARRAAMPASALGAGSGRSPVPLPAARTQGMSSGDSDAASSGSESDAADRPWASRTAHSAISKLDSLYENTKSESFGGSASLDTGVSGAVPSSSRAVLESTRDKWDLDGVPSNLFPAAATPKRTPPSKPPVKPPPKRALVGGNNSIKKAKGAQPAVRVKGSKIDKVGKPKGVNAGRGGKSVAAVATRNNNNSSRLGSRNTRTPPAVSQPASSDHEAATSVFEMSDLLSSSPIFTRSKGPRRPAKSKRSCGSMLEDNDSLLSSSPPSTPGRLLESSKDSQRLGSHAGSEFSDSDSIRENKTRAAADVNATPMAQVGNRQVLNSIQGPSTATSKRLQMRAYTHNVVYTYGRSRDDEDYELGDGGGALGSEISPALRLQAAFETTSRLTLENTQHDGKKRAHGSLLDLVEATDPNASSDNANRNENEQAASGGPFKQQVGDIIHGLGTASRSEDSASASCEKLLSKLEDQDFCDDLLENKSRLSALVHALGRIRDDPVVLSTTMTLIAIAFQTPTAMQMLVFEKQILETVAGILKAVSTNTVPDILALRHRQDFDTPAQYGCAEQICRLASGHGLLDGGRMPLSTYNMALCALYGFSRSDDVALVAMAPLLRNEMHESGCLGLVAERGLVFSVPTFVVKQRNSLSTVPNASARGLFSKGSDPCILSTLSKDDCNDDDDEWMDFDLPEETKKAPVSFAGKNPKAGVGKIKTTAAANSTEHGNRNAKMFERSLSQEPRATAPSLASICIELEILRFCIAANVLETLALGLQLLVNLSYGSTLFCSRFFADDGLATVAKSIALMSRGLATTYDKHSRSVHDHKAYMPPGRSAQLAEDANSLKYDVLLISCALLINVVESDPSSTVYFAHVLQSPRCQLAGKCFPACSCIDKIPLVALITGAFLARCSEEESNIDASVTAGYLSVLLGFLMRDPGPVRQAVLEQLPRKTTSILLEHIRKFVHISSTVNQKVASGLMSSLGAADADTHSDCRMQQQTIGQHQCLPSPLGQYHPLHEDIMEVVGARGSGHLDVYGKKQSLPASLQYVIDILGKI